MEIVRDLKNRGILILLGIIFLFMLAQNYMVPLFNDDYFYVLNLNSEEKINDFAGVVNSVSNFREMHNGRVAAHFFAQLFLWLPRIFFIIINAAMYTLLSYGVYRYTKSESKKRNVLLLFCASAMIWLLVPGFAHGFLWLTGSCSYLWAITFIVLFLYPFFDRYMNGAERRNANIAKETFAIAYAFFVGSYSENGSFSALTVAACFLLLIFAAEKKLPLNLTLRFLTACAGFLYLMLAPSELGKKNVDASEGPMFPMLDSVGISTESFVVFAAATLAALAIFVWAVIRYRKPVCKAAACISAVLLLAVSLVLAIYEIQNAGSLLDAINLVASNVLLNIALMFGLSFVLLMWALYYEVEIKKVFSALCFVLGAIASLAVFFVAVYFPARGAAVAAVFTSLASLLLISGICDKCGEKPGKLFAAVILIGLLPTLVAGSVDANDVYRQYRQRKEIIMRAQVEGAESLLLSPMVSVGKYTVPWQGEAADYYYGMQNYYGIDSIIIEGIEEFE